MIKSIEQEHNTQLVGQEYPAGWNSNGSGVRYAACQADFYRMQYLGYRFLRLFRVNRFLTTIKIFRGTIIIYRSVRIFIIGYDVCDRIFTVI